MFALWEIDAMSARSPTPSWPAGMSAKDIAEELERLCQRLSEEDRLSARSALRDDIRMLIELNAETVCTALAASSETVPLDEIKATLQRACDRDWKDETLFQTAVIASNAIYWRDQEIARLKQAAPSATHAITEQERRNIIEACAQIAERTYPRGEAHTYASENADRYIALEDGCCEAAKRIRAIMEKP